MTLSKLWERVKDREGWCAAVRGATKRHYFTTEQQLCVCVCVVCVREPILFDIPGIYQIRGFNHLIKSLVISSSNIYFLSSIYSLPSLWVLWIKTTTTLLILFSVILSTSLPLWYLPEEGGPKHSSPQALSSWFLRVLQPTHRVLYFNSTFHTYYL